jgi:hypothetical protein
VNDAQKVVIADAGWYSEAEKRWLRDRVDEECRTALRYAENEPTCQLARGRVGTVERCEQVTSVGRGKRGGGTRQQRSGDGKLDEVAFHAGNARPAHAIDARADCSPAS